MNALYLVRRNGVGGHFAACGIAVRAAMLTVSVGAALLLTACREIDTAPAYAPTLSTAPMAARLPTYSFGVAPLENFRHIFALYQPIVDHLNARLVNARLVLEVPRALDDHQRLLHEQRYAFALANPYYVWQSAHHDGYRVIAKMDDDAAFHGVLVVRRDSGITRLGDLKGKTICYPPPSALAATMLTRFNLQQHGFDLQRDLHERFVASQHASIMQVYQGQAQAGATWPLAWLSFQQLHPQEAAALEVRFPTAPLINLGLVARADVPIGLARQVATLLAELDQSSEGRAMLARLPLSRFTTARTADYDRVGSFVSLYRRTIRVEAP